MTAHAPSRGASEADSEADAGRSSRPQDEPRDAPLDADGWDERFPGILDAAAGLGGAANIILQLARPEVGYGVIESRVHEGNVFRHPWKRARTTFTYLAVAMVGTEAEKHAYRMAVNRAHRQVVSTDASKVRYHAMDPELQLWVAACLMWGVVDSLERFRGRLPDDRREELYRRCQTLGTTLQVRASMWPPDYPSFERWFESRLAEVTLDDTVRAYLDSLVALRMLPTPVRVLFAPTMRFFTTGFLPPSMRDAMRYPWTERDQLLFESIVGLVGATQAVLPRALRQAPTRLLMADLRRRIARGEALT